MQEDIKNEGVQKVEDFFTIDKSDAELVSMIDRKIRSAYGEYEKLKTEGTRNERYWANEQLQGINLYWHNSRIVQNRIYMGTETMVPIITSKPAEPMITMAGFDEKKDGSEKEREFLRQIERMLLDKYYDEDHPQQEVFEMIARHLLLYKIGIPKIRWDDDMDDYIVEFVHPHKMIISPDGHYNEDVWTAEYMEWTLGDIIKEFPEQESTIMHAVFPGVSSPEKLLGTPLGFWEYWSEDGKYLVWKMNSVILQKKLNPYMVWSKDKTFDKDKNHFSYPKKPYMFLNSQNLGRHIWDDTTPISQGISLQDGINLMQRIITDTARDQGILVGAQEGIDRDELYKYTGAYNEKLSIKGGNPQSALYRVAPKQLAPHVQENLLHLENASDNIMGTHATTRGEKSKQPTLGQDVMSKESDYGRIDAVVRGIERVANAIYNWELQMIAVKYKEDHYTRVLGDEDGKKAYEKMKEGIKKRIKITVKPGSTLPVDKITQRNEAIELAKADKISDLDFFERMDYPNPREMAKRVFLQKNKPEMLYPDLIKEMEEDAKKKAKESGKMNEDGMIQPPAGQVPSLGMQPGIPPTIPQEVPQPSLIPQTPQQVGTEHTQALVQGQQVQPFEGIDPTQYATHVSAELQFMGSQEFTQIPEQLQALYAQHVMAERQVVNDRQTGQPISG